MLNQLVVKVNLLLLVSIVKVGWHYILFSIKTYTYSNVHFFVGEGAIFNLDF